MDESSARHLLAELERHADGLLANFTGREWLVERIRSWQDDPCAKPFLLIQGAAGIGKSAFAAHLWRTQRMVTAAHFCIAGRGGTTEPLTFVEVLSAQLAVALPGFAEARRRVIDAYARQTVQIQAEVQTGDVHPGGQVTSVAVQFRLESIPPEQAFDLLIRRPLREVAAAGGLSPVLLLVDALDEALTHHTLPTILHLLQKSGDLPSQVRWVLTSRPEPRVTQALADLPVEILDAADHRHQSDVRQYLRARVGELEQTARAWGMGGDALVEYLGQRSEWNFLYLTSIWPDLAEGRIPSPEKLPVGLDGYYHYLLDTRVGADAWQEWGADLMEVLLALQEPVDLETLASFLGWQPRLTHQRVLRMAQVLSPALLQAGRYFRHHWSLAEFLRDRARAGPWWCDLTGKHRQIAESILSGWGGLEAGLPGLRRIEGADYGTRHLVAHLIEGGQYEQAGRLLRLEWEESPHPVHAWHAVHERLGTPQDFEQGLRRVWETASAINREAASQGQICPKLGDEIRYALIEASLHSLAGNIPPELLAALVEHNVWTPTAALAYARQMPDEEKRAEALAGLAPHLPEDLLQDALAAARKIGNEFRRAEALVGLAPHLPEDLLREALAVAREIVSEDDRVKALASLAAYMREELLLEVFAVAVKTKSEGSRAKALTGLAPYLPENLLREALTVATGIREEYARAYALAGLAPYLPETLLCEALSAARKIKWAYARAYALAGLISNPPKGLQEQVIREALFATMEISNENDRTKAITRLVPYLPKEPPSEALDEALAAARGIRDEIARDHTLSRLSPRLAELGRYEESLVIAREIKNEYIRVSVLAELVHHLPERLLGEALATAMELESEIGRAEALTSLVPHLTKIMQEQAVREALIMARKIKREYTRAAILTGLAPYLTEELLGEALATAKEIGSESDRVRALTGLAPYLSEELLGEVLAAVREIGSEYNRAEALASLALHLTEELLCEALAAAKEIRSEGERARALIGLIPHLPEELLREALAITMGIDNKDYCTRALVKMALQAPKRLQGQILHEALAAVRTIGDENHRVYTMVSLYPHLPEELREQALAILRKIGSEDDRARALASLAPHLSEGFLGEALLAAREINDENARVRALVGLAPHLPEGLLGEALAATREIGSEYHRIKALTSLAPHLPEGLLDEALAATKEIGSEYTRVKALTGLVPYLPEDLRQQALQEALATAREIPDKYDRSQAIFGLIPYLSEDLQEQILSTIPFAARQSWWTEIELEEDANADVLTNIGSHPPEELLFETLAAKREIHEESDRARALAGLALRLAELPRAALYALWAETLPVLARRTRQDLLSDLSALAPLIHALGGEQAVVETFRAIQDVGRWWP